MKFQKLALIALTVPSFVNAASSGSNFDDSTFGKTVAASGTAFRGTYGSIVPHKEIGEALEAAAILTEVGVEPSKVKTPTSAPRSKDWGEILGHPDSSTRSGSGGGAEEVAKFHGGHGRTFSILSTAHDTNKVAIQGAAEVAEAGLMIGKARGAVNNLTDQRAAAETEADTQARKVETLTATAADTSGRITGIEEELNTARSNLSAAKTNADTARATLETVEAQLNNAKSIAQTTATSVNDANKELNDANVNLVGLKRIAKSLDKDISAAIAERDSAQASATQAQRQVDAAIAKKGELESLLESARKAAAEMNSATETVKVTASAAKDVKSTAAGPEGSAAEKATDAVKAANGAVTTAEREVAKADGEINQANELLQSFQRSVASATAKFDELNSRKATIDSDIVTATDKVTAAQTNVQTTTDALKAANSELTTAQKSVADAKNKLIAAMLTAGTTEKEVKVKEATLKSLQTEHEAQNEAIRVATEDANAAKARASKLGRDADLASTILVKQEQTLAGALKMITDEKSNLAELIRGKISPVARKLDIPTDKK